MMVCLEMGVIDYKLLPTLSTLGLISKMWRHWLSVDTLILSHIFHHYHWQNHSIIISFMAIKFWIFVLNSLGGTILSHFLKQLVRGPVQKRVKHIFKWIKKNCQHTTTTLGIVCARLVKISCWGASCGHSPFLHYMISHGRLTIHPGVVSCILFNASERCSFGCKSSSLREVGG